MEKKSYILSAGKHYGSDSNGNPVVFVKGDRIELTKEQAIGLANKIIDPEAVFGIDEVATLKQRIVELELEVEQLKEAIDEDA